MDIAKLVEGGAYGIAIALIVLILIGGKAFLDYLKNRETAHTKCYEKLEKTMDKSNKIAEESNRIQKQTARIVNETYKFMRKLNGSLKTGVKKAKK